MTKKHFILLADALKESRPLFPSDEQKLQWEQDVHTVANCCASVNPLFNRSRWMDYINGKCGKNGGKVK